jgi:hypothetical protein
VQDINFYISTHRSIVSTFFICYNLVVNPTCLDGVPKTSKCTERRQLGFATGIPRVRFSYTVPEPVEPVPVSGIHRHRTLNGAVSYETHGITCTRGFVVLPCPPFNLAKVSRTSIDVRRAVLEVIRGGGRIQNRWVGDLPWQ